MAGKKGKPKRRSSGKKLLRVDLFVEAQRKAVERFGDYLVKSVDLIQKGQFSPTQWIQLSADMWAGLAKDLGAVTKKF